MTNLLNPIEQDRCLSLKCEGNMRVADLNALHQQIKAVLKAHSLRRVLLDVTDVHYISTPLGLFYFAAEAFSDLPRDAQISLLVRPGQVKYAKALDMMARRAGTSLKFFVDAEKAELWAKGGRPLATSRNLKMKRRLDRCVKESSNV